MEKLLSVVIPCYNEQEVIEETYRQLTVEMEKLAQSYELRYELIFVNDGSKDNTLSLLHSFHASHKETHGDKGQVRVISLARNFGHQCAISAGFETAKGDAIAAIDADLQDPPAVIEEMYKRYLNGVDVAYGVRLTRQGEPAFKLISTKIFYRLLHKMTKVDIPLDTGDFRLISRRALDLLNSMPERHRYIRGMIPWLGLRQEPVEYHRHARHAGKSKYPFTDLLKLAIEGVTSFSHVPLRLAGVMGLVVSFACLLFAANIVINKMLDRPIGGVDGWASLMVAVLFLGSVQLISIGLLGEYLGRIYDEVKRRPLYVIDEVNSRGE